ncbi:MULTISPECIES: SIS domain-containing protein [unclassified Bosea (in: a-proteobacteria)]|uniref:SIS domain-containing protein n=1 Tax=unclassified Bosea (in: a-proteobacteria) TaxID=2653178 RepID=UPI000F757F42|nr:MULTISPECIES: SIS domain-containing protein [unclassified Bosea (in: a-proteobacteria)]AZO80108.1 iron dicitrate transport regulator FecR [Bosea sp. Tri-49]RXT22895.1 iron dicitrate transport regulator FecR [Bosea sp. Tri-39]RXT38364.1 iron dicitrate transport regulator FecR [Bosea sp. Tri-54]
MAEALLTCEAAEAAAVARRQFMENGAIVADLVQRLRIKRPAFVATCARGSSDHAASYGKYLIERALGLPVASLGPSLASVYGGELDLSRALFIAVSQSGRSPDALLLTEAAKRAGALVVGFVNDETSPLAGMVDMLVPLRAGPERSVAATKSFLATCLAFLHLTAEWARDDALRAALTQAPEALDAAGHCDWKPALLSWREARSLYLIGRGLSFGIAQEIALKFKETCRIHAEAFSAAEVLHGPLALVEPGFPALALDPGDEGSESVCDAATAFTGLGADLRYAGRRANPEESLPLPPDLPAALLPLAQVRAFYGAVAALAESRGLDPDRPPHLSKVTRTV